MACMLFKIKEIRDVAYFAIQYLEYVDLRNALTAL